MGSFVDERSAEERLLVGLSRIGTVLRSQRWRGMAPGGPHPTQAQFLVELLRTHPEGARLSELAERLALTPPTASESISALERKGLVERRIDPADRRARVIVLTEAGQRAAAGAESWPDVLMGAVQELNESERGVLLRLVVKLIRSLQVRGEISPQRMCVTCRHFQPGVHEDPHRPHHCGFVDAPFGDGQLRIDCRDHDPLRPGEEGGVWAEFVARGPAM